MCHTPIFKLIPQQAYSQATMVLRCPLCQHTFVLKDTLGIISNNPAHHQSVLISDPEAAQMMKDFLAPKPPVNQSSL